MAGGRRKAAEKVNGHGNGDIPALAGHGPTDMGRGSTAADGGKRVQFVDMRAKESGEKLPNKPPADNASGAGTGGPGDTCVRGKRPVQQTNGKVLRSSILLP